MKKSKIFSICTICAAALGLIFWLFLSGASRSESGASVKATGMAIIFGGKASASYGGMSMDIDAFKFSFVLFIGFIAAIAGIVMAVLNLVGKQNKIFTIIAICCFVVAALFCFLTKTCAVVKEGGSLDELNLGIGAILGGILFIGAAVTSTLPICIKD